MKIKVKKLHPEAKLPTKAHANDACYDLYAVEDKYIPPHKTVKIKTGIAMEFPNDKYYGRIYPRSGLSSEGIVVGAGIIDPNYRGEIIVVLHNTTENPYFVHKGDRIAQFTIHKRYNVKFEEVTELSESDRQDKGFGSTGR